MLAPARAAPARAARDRALPPGAARPPGDRGLRPAPPDRGRRRGQGGLHAPTRSPPCTSVSGGVPRLVNLICDRALLAGYVAGTRTIDAGMVRRGRDRGRRRARAPARRAGRPCGRGRRGLAALGAGRAVRPARRIGGAGASGGRGHCRRAPRPRRRPRRRPRADGRARRSSRRCSRCERDASLRGAVGDVQALWGGGPPRAHDAAHAHGPGARGSTCPSSWRCSIPRAATPASWRCCASKATRRWWPRARAGRCACPWPSWTGCGRGRRCSCGATSTRWRRPPTPVRTAAWARESLARLGYLGRDLDLAGAVSRFQRDSELAPDGVIGSRTIMTLYSLGSYYRPRLRERRGAVS